MKNYKFDIKDFYGKRSVVISAHSKFQASQDVTTTGTATIKCTTTDTPGTLITSHPISKKLSLFLKQLDDGE